MQDIPGTVESYLMQVAMEVAKTRAAKPNQVKLSQFRLNFVRPEAPAEADKQQQVDRILATKKARYRRMGGK